MTNAGIHEIAQADNGQLVIHTYRHSKRWTVSDDQLQELMEKWPSVNRYRGSVSLKEE